MASLPRSSSIDRDDYDADHYADFLRDTHRSRLLADQLDTARRQLRKKQTLLSRTHQLKMKEHTRVRNDFIRKIQQNSRISTLPCVKDVLNVQQRSSSTRNEYTNETAMLNKIDGKVHSSKVPIETIASQQQRTKVNLDRFNHDNAFID
jgi:hypothetical protein